MTRNLSWAQYVDRDLSAAPDPPLIASMCLSYAFASLALIGPFAPPITALLPTSPLLSFKVTFLYRLSLFCSSSSAFFASSVMGAALPTFSGYNASIIDRLSRAVTGSSFSSFRSFRLFFSFRPFRSFLLLLSDLSRFDDCARTRGRIVCRQGRKRVVRQGKSERRSKVCYTLEEECVQWRRSGRHREATGSNWRDETDYSARVQQPPPHILTFFLSFFSLLRFLLSRRDLELELDELELELDEPELLSELMRATGPPARASGRPTNAFPSLLRVTESEESRRACIRACSTCALSHPVQSLPRACVKSTQRFNGGNPAPLLAHEYLLFYYTTQNLDPHFKNSSVDMSFIYPRKAHLTGKKPESFPTSHYK